MKYSLCRFGKRYAFSVSAFAFISSLGSIAQSAEATSTTSVAATAAVMSEVAPVRSRPKAKLGVAVTGRRINDQYVKSNTFGPSLTLDGEHAFSQKLKARLLIVSIISSGTASSLFTTEGQPQTLFFVTEAAVNFQPIDEFSARGGILETKFSTNQSLFSARGFPGLSESVKIGNDNLNGVLIATQTMPTASGVAKNYNDNSAEANLFLHTLGVNAGAKEAILSASASLTHFVFGELPANAAQDSRFYGNSVAGLGATAAKFMYRFEGFEASGVLRSRLSGKVKMELKGAALRNDRAPTGKNSAYNATFVPSYETAAIEIKPEAGYFYNESDTLPAAYTSIVVANNNRQGLLIGLSAKFKEENVTVNARWVQADKIDSNPYTADRNIVTVGVETSYDIL